MATVRKRYVSHGERQVHLRELAARGVDRLPPLLCLHPAPYSGLFFTSVMPLLNENRRVIAADYPGYGGSDQPEGNASIATYADAMLEVIHDTNAKVDLLGFHTGCLVAAEILLARPDTINRCVLCDVPYFTGEEQAALRRKTALPLPLSEELDCLSDAWSANVDSKLGDMPLSRAFALFVERLRAGTGDFHAFAAAFSYDCRTRLAMLSGNEIAVLATRSNLRDATLRAAEVIPGARLVEADDIAGGVFERNAGITAAYLREALQ